MADEKLQNMADPNYMDKRQAFQDDLIQNAQLDEPEGFQGNPEENYQDNG